MNKIQQEFSSLPLVEIFQCMTGTTNFPLVIEKEGN